MMYGKEGRMIKYIFISLAVLAIDIYTKSLAIKNLLGKTAKPLIKGFLSLYYTENTGAAFSIFRDQALLLVCLPIAMLIGIVIYVFVVRSKNPFFLTGVSLILGGGIGNLIDRISKGYVVDFLRFDFVDFPIFNFADTFVFMGTVLLLFYCFFTKEGREIGSRKASDN